MPYRLDTSDDLLRVTLFDVVTAQDLWTMFDDIASSEDRPDGAKLNVALLRRHQALQLFMPVLDDD